MRHTTDANWLQIMSHKDLITRCCKHLHYKKYPVPDGLDEALSLVQNKLYFSGVLQRFDPKRHPADIVTKRFEQYTYQWVEQILRNAHRRTRLERKLFRGQGPEEISQDTLRSYDNTVSGGPHGATPSDDNVKDKKYRWPGIHNLHDFLGQHAEDIEESIRIKGYRDAFKGVLQTEQEKKIGQLLLLDYRPEDISKILKVNKSKTHATIKKIRQRARNKIGA